ncbi:MULTISPECIES: ABC transporter ATP-binding protein [Microbacterium]|uniref:ABC transporter ATP-binding protein n=1 Tax=Microbacterium TaxID=33882 RepID=UPI00217D4BF3|nr:MULTISPECIES: energy-coupling factor transporter ATPase [Microbacterium]
MRDLSVTHAGAARPSPQAVSFDVHPGEVVLLLGPSGSGKSTLTLALNGLVPQSVPAELSGTVVVAGRDTRSTPVAQLSTDVAMVFQDPDAQLVTGTVLDEVAFALENLLLPVPEILHRSEQALRQVGLWERRSWNPDLLSGGARQRLAIACALAMRPRVIVLDEPTANLDPRGIDDVYDALSTLVTDAGRAVVLVEHNLDAAMRFATRAIALDAEGRMAFDGPAAQVIREHAEELLSLGVWLPSSTLAALRLRALGAWSGPLPVTAEEFAERMPGTRRGPGGAPADAERSAAGHSAAGPSVAERSAGERTEPAVVVRDLVVRKGGTSVLTVESLDIPRSAFTAVIGVNGAGKTTLIQALGGVAPPPRGTVRVAGIDVGAASPRRLVSRIGFVFQNPEHQFIAHTVRDELAHGLRLQHRPAAEIDARVDQMLDRFGLAGKAGVHPFLLSGGEKRRLSVGTALITQPEVLALDEPTFGQDRARAAEMLELLTGLRADGTTIVIVTHDLQLVAEYSTHAVVLAGGRLHAAGETARLLADEALLHGAGLRMPPVLRMLSAAGAAS